MVIHHYDSVGEGTPAETLGSSATISVSNNGTSSTNGKQRNLIVKPRSALAGSSGASYTSQATDESSKENQNPEDGADGPIQRCVPKYDYETGTNLQLNLSFFQCYLKIITLLETSHER